jgi:hypothetical protein
MKPRRILCRGSRSFGLVSFAVLLAACGGASPSPITEFPTSTPTPTPTTVSPQNLKPMIQGLIDRDGPPPKGFLGPVSAFVVNVTWSQLQPTPYGSLTPDNPIDQAIAAARALGDGVGVKIRLLTGIDAPAWVKALDGGPVSVYSTLDQVGGTIGRFWTADFGHAYDDLWDKLAAEYDSIPQIREITVSRCMTVFAETFLRDTSDPTTVGNLLAAGFSAGADQTCIQQEIADGTVWKQTRIGVAFNPYQEILPGAVVITDEAFTESMMQYCRTELGAQCVLENNSIRWPPMAGQYPEMYSSIQSLGAPISFQTATGARIGSLAQTLTWAAGIGADAVELPQGYESTPLSTLAAGAEVLQRNPI